MKHRILIGFLIVIVFSRCSHPIGGCIGTPEECKCHADGGPRKSYICGTVFITDETLIVPKRAWVNTGSINDVHLSYELRDGAFDTNSTSFKNFIKRYQDDSYDDCESCPSGIIIDTIQSISFYADKNYDKNHPAGTRLDDIMYIRYSSVKKYIQNGYNRNKTLPSVDREEDIKDTLKTFNNKWKENYLIEADGMYFSFISPPDETTTFIFTMEYAGKYGYYDGANRVKKTFPSATVYSFK